MKGDRHGTRKTIRSKDEAMLVLRMPQYLLKFLKREHLDYLLNIGLFMNAAGYFSATGYEKNDNQNDFYEGLAIFPYRELPQREKTVMERLAEAKTEFDKFCAKAPIINYNVYKGRRRPIWCCTGIDKEDISDGIFKIDKRVLYDFFKNTPQNGVAVLITFDDFLNLLKSNPDEYETIYGYVDYRNIHKINGCLANSNAWWDSIFTKRIDLSYQKEFRIAICRNCKENLEDIIINHVNTRTLKKDRPYREYEYRLPNIQSVVAKIFNVSELPQDNKYLYINVT